MKLQLRALSSTKGRNHRYNVNLHLLFQLGLLMISVLLI